MVSFKKQLESGISPLLKDKSREEIKSMLADYIDDNILYVHDELLKLSDDYGIHGYYLMTITLMIEGLARLEAIEFDDKES